MKDRFKEYSDCFRRYQPCTWDEACEAVDKYHAARQQAGRRRAQHYTKAEGLASPEERFEAVIAYQRANPFLTFPEAAEELGEKFIDMALQLNTSGLADR